MKMDAGIDTGPVFSTRQVPILETDDAQTLGQKLAEIGGDLLLETLPAIYDGSAQMKQQSEDGATYASMLKKEDGLLDFTQTVSDLFNRVRAFYPWPGTWLMWENQPLKIIKARPFTGVTGLVGTKAIHQGLPVVYCSDGALILEEVQPAGKKPMNGKVFLNGARDWGKG